MSATLILGDPHIGGSLSMGKVGIGTTLNSCIIDQFQILEWVLQQAQEYQVSNIIITGDIFEDVRPHYNLIILFIEWLKKCEEHNIAVHIILGNHDLLRSGNIYSSSLDILSSCEFHKVFFYKRITTLHLDGISFTLIPFRDRRSFNTDLNTEALDLLKEAIPFELTGIDIFSKKVVIGHLALEKSIPIGFELGELSNELFCPISMFSGYDYVFMGHIHRWQLLSQKQPYAAHIGSMCLSDFGEQGQKKFVAILDPAHSEFLRYLQIPTRPIKQIDIEIPETCINVMQYIDSSLQELHNLEDTTIRVNITFFGSQSVIINRSLIEKTLYSKGVFHIVRISEERKLSSIQTISNNIDNTINELSAIQMFAQSLDKDLREDFISAAKTIVSDIKAKN